MVPACSTTNTTMTADLRRSNPFAAPMRVHHSNSSEDSVTNPSSPSTDYEFDESECLFCNQTSPDLDRNLVHMSKLHGLHIDMTNLLVDLASLLAYFHVIISGCYECLYCGTQRKTRQAIQQHMMAKGHCKYDITDKDAELRDFYDISSSDTGEEVHRRLAAMRLSDDAQLPSQAIKRTRPSKRPDRHSPNITASPLDQAQPTPTSPSHAEAESSSNAARTPSHTIGEVSTRTVKQEYTLNNQLSKLRANDQRNLAHLPASQQRALLGTQHRQRESARRTEQTNRGNLEHARNTFGCLSKTRLIRRPPHFGHVQSLKH